MNFFNKTQCLLLVAHCFIIFYGFLACAQTCRIENDSAIIDQRGRKIIVHKPFKRIISLYGAHTENLFALGLDNEIIGVSKNEVFPPKALAKTAFSYHGDAEKFLAFKPDIVLIRPMIDRAYSQLITRLEKSKITVVSLQPNSINEMYIYWKILGILTGKQKKSCAMVKQFQQNVLFFQSLTKNINYKKRVYFEAIHSKMKTFSPNSMAIFVLETAGGINVARNAKQVRNTNIATYGKERILSHFDEIDVYIAQFGIMNRPTLEIIKNESGFNLIKAVKNNEIYFIDEMIVSRPTLRLLDGIYEIGKILYPKVSNGRRPLKDW